MLTHHFEKTKDTSWFSWFYASIARWALIGCQNISNRYVWNKATIHPIQILVLILLCVQLPVCYWDWLWNDSFSIKFLGRLKSGSKAAVNCIGRWPDCSGHCVIEVVKPCQCIGWSVKVWLYTVCDLHQSDLSHWQCTRSLCNCMDVTYLSWSLANTLGFRAKIWLYSVYCILHTISAEALPILNPFQYF